MTDEDQRQLGTTYPKRAAGLVKKGRAVWINASEIRLKTEKAASHCPSGNDISEDNQMNELYFNAKEWKPNPECEQNVAERTFINSTFGNLREIYMLGNWNMTGSYTELFSPEYHLDKCTAYHFVFWLNGGENDRRDEICQLQIVYDKDSGNKDIFKLNRKFISAVKSYKGWYLYNIPFTTGENETTQLQFAVKGAYTSIMHADSIESYTDLQNEPDEFEQQRPQRHNIVFEEGWPADRWYATEQLKKRKDGSKRFSEDFKRGTENFGESMKDFGKDMEDFGKRMYEKVRSRMNHGSKEEDGESEKSDSFYNCEWTEEDSKDVREAMDDAKTDVREAVEDVKDTVKDAEQAMKEAQESMQDAVREAEEAIKEAEKTMKKAMYEAQETMRRAEEASGKSADTANVTVLDN